VFQLYYILQLDIYSTAQYVYTSR